MLTYKSFTDLETLYDLLVQRFWVEPPVNLHPKEHRDWISQKRNIIRIRWALQILTVRGISLCDGAGY